jgi:hypothetical protein
MLRVDIARKQVPDGRSDLPPRPLTRRPRPVDDSRIDGSRPVPQPLLHATDDPTGQRVLDRVRQRRGELVECVLVIRVGLRRHRGHAAKVQVAIEPRQPA